MAQKTVQIGGIAVGNDCPLVVIAGPCQLESLDHAQMIAGRMAEICRAAGAGYPVILLNTLADMEAARELYATLGCEDVAPYYYNPIPGAHYLKAVLGESPSRY